MNKLSATTRKRLTILRDALIEHAKDPGNLKFDLDSWARLPVKYRYSTDPTSVVCGARLAENFCGTSACAMGLAASIPAFNKLGLKLEREYGYVEVVHVHEGEDSSGFHAAESFFGISFEDACELFSPNQYDNARERKNPLAVADKITAYLEAYA